MNLWTPIQALTGLALFLVIPIQWDLKSLLIAVLLGLYAVSNYWEGRTDGASQ